MMKFTCVSIAVFNVYFYAMIQLKKKKVLECNGARGRQQQQQKGYMRKKKNDTKVIEIEIKYKMGKHQKMFLMIWMYV